MQRTSPNAATEVADQSSSQCVIVSYWYQKLCVSLSKDTLTYCDGQYRPLHNDIFTQLPCVSMWQLRRRIIVVYRVHAPPQKKTISLIIVHLKKQKGEGCTIAYTQFSYR